MKKITKILGGLTIAGLAGWLTYKVGKHFYNTYKSEMNALEEQERVAEEELTELGVSSKTLQDVVNDGEEDDDLFQRTVFTCLRFNQGIEEDYVNPRSSFTQPNVIHARQTEYNGREFFDIIFEIPNYVNGRGYSGYNAPQIPDYIREFNAQGKYLAEEIVKFADKPLCKLEGYIGVHYTTDPNFQPDVDDIADDKKWDVKSTIFSLDDSLYKSFSDDRHDGLTNYYRAFRKGDEGFEEGGVYNSALNEWIRERILDEVEDSENIQQVFFKAEHIFLAFKISFPIATPGTSNRMRMGINAIQAAKCIKHLLYNCEVSRDGGNGKAVIYDRVMVHAKDEAGVPSFTHYYDHDPETGETFVSWFLWEDKGVLKG